ncbi:MAG: nitroreductase family protein [Desulfovibrio sp.]|nr:MAG: nitroreductase family protein [Desulfovibrio sp.]
MSQSNAILTALKERRSIRKYTDEPITDQEIAEILDAGRWAPSGLNNQPWRFLVVRGNDPRKAALVECTKYAAIVRNCSALICVFLEKSKMYNAMKDHQAIGACLQNMLLAAHGLGLGGVWLGEIINQSEQVMDALALDGETFEFQAAIALGRPAVDGSSSRVPLGDLMLEEL